eukprot:2054763-Pyramimonas_sp.AAC.2
MGSPNPHKGDGVTDDGEGENRVTPLCTGAGEIVAALLHPLIAAHRCRPPRSGPMNKNEQNMFYRNELVRVHVNIRREG